MNHKDLPIITDTKHLGINDLKLLESKLLLERSKKFN